MVRGLGEGGGKGGGDRAALQKTSFEKDVWIFVSFRYVQFFLIHRRGEIGDLFPPATPPPRPLPHVVGARVGAEIDQPTHARRHELSDVVHSMYDERGASEQTSSGSLPIQQY